MLITDIIVVLLLEERDWSSILSAFINYQTKYPIRQPLRQSDGREEGGCSYGKCRFSVYGEMRP